MAVITEYVDMDGYISVNGTQVAKPVEFSVGWTRQKADYAVVGEWGFRHVPGLLDVSTLDITRVLDDGSLHAGMLTSTPTTGTVQTVVTAGATLNTAGIVTQAGTNGGNGKLQVTMAGSTTTTATVLTFYGTDIIGNPVVDYIIIPLGTTAGTLFQTRYIFNVISTITNGTAAGAGATFGIASLAGTANAAPGSPTLYSIVGKVQEGTNNVMHTFPNCFIVKGGAIHFKAGQNGKLDDVMSLVPKKVADCYISWVNA